jgi:hypothetical protein
MQSGDPCIYVCGDKRLGPIVLPRIFPLSCELGPDSGYRRFGGLCPGEFLATYTNASTGQYIYPPMEGFQIDTTGKAIISSISLEAGTLVDRFGRENGTYMSPGEAPFAQRSLPPVQLNDAPPEYPDNYHAYTVLKTMVVQAGPVAPWFAQPGFGIQLLMPDSVINLVDGGYLGRVNLTRAGGKKVADGKAGGARVADAKDSDAMVSAWE